MASEETRGGNTGAEGLRNIRAESSPAPNGNKNTSLILLLICFFSAVAYFTLSTEIRANIERLVGRTAP
jgi:hypothetical protein